MANLLKETLEDIKLSGHTIMDIIFIGSEESGYYCNWEEFTKLANQEYDDGFGAQEVATDLIIVFSDGSKMWRHEYDGSERWDYSTPFEMPQKVKQIKSLFVNSDDIGWQTIAEINDKYYLNEPKSNKKD